MRAPQYFLALFLISVLPSLASSQYQAYVLQALERAIFANGVSGGGVAGQLRISYLIPNPREGGFTTVFDDRACWWPTWYGESVMLDGTEGTRSMANAISGISVGGIRNNRAVLWPTGTPNDFIDLTPAGASSAFLTSMDGTSQGGWATYSMVHPAVWFGSAASFVDLMPPSISGPNDNGEVLGTAPGVQVGRMFIDRGGLRAYKWNNTAASGVDCTPAGVIGAGFLGTDGTQHVGYVVITGNERERAAIWSADGSTWTNIHPAGLFQSLAYACRGGKQVGFTSTAGFNPHAWLWQGSAESSLDLQSFLPVEFTASRATGIDENGVISGYAYAFEFGFQPVAVVWVPTQTNQAPTANAGVDQEVVYASVLTSVSLDGSESSDPDDGDSITYEWKEGSEVLGTNPQLDAQLSAGKHDITLTVTDETGETSTDIVKVSIVYSWGGVQAPINSDGSSVFKLGSTVPVKFVVDGASSSAGDIGARLYLAKMSDSVFGTEEEASSTSGADSGNTFRYVDGKFMFNLSTKTLSVGTWRLRVDLGDGATHTVVFSLK